MTQGDELAVDAAQHERIERELAAIERSPAFVRSPVMKRLLRFIISESEAGRGPQIKSYTLAVDGLGRPEDFDAQQDSYPRVQIGRLRKALEQYYRHHSPVEGMRFDLRPGGYQIHFVETDAADSEFAPGRPGADARPAWLHRILGGCCANKALILFSLLAMALLGLLAGGGLIAPWTGGDRQFAGDGLESPPLVALEPVDAEGIEGVDPELGSWLTSRIAGAILSTHWAMVRSAEGEAKARARGNVQPADYDLRTRLYREDEKLFLTLDLIDTKRGFTAWTRVMPLDLRADGSVTNLDEVLSRLVSQVFAARGVVPALTMQRNGTHRPQAGYSCMVYAALFWYDRKRQDFKTARECVKQTLAISPRYGQAWGALAMLEYADHDFNYSGNGAGGAGRAWDAISNGTAAEPEDPFLRSVLAYVFFRQGNYRQAHAEAVKGYQLDPYSSLSLMRLGGIMFFTGDREGLKLVERAQAVDPNPGPWYWQPMFFDAMANGRTDEAIRLAAAMPEGGGAGRGYINLIRAICFAMKGDGPAARSNWHLVAERAPGADANPRVIFDSIGVSKPYADKALALLRRAGAVQ